MVKQEAHQHAISSPLRDIWLLDIGLNPILEGMDVLQDVHLVPHFSPP